MTDYFAVRNACARALRSGAKRISLSHIEWDISGSCTDAVYQSLHAQPPSRNGTVIVDRDSRTPFHLEMWVRCKRCDACLKYRQWAWSHRAQNEMRNSIRTWFGTLTLAPEHQHKAYAEACRRYAINGDFDALGFDAQFAGRCKVIGEEITRYLKRVRFESKAKIRYLFVAEHHKSGLPHYHCLIHERDLIGVNESILREQWKLGFTKWHLTEGSEARYVCKYLSKSKASRLRASLIYGKLSLDIAKVFGNLEREENDPPTLHNAKGPTAPSERAAGERSEEIGLPGLPDSINGLTLPTSVY